MRSFLRNSVEHSSSLVFADAKGCDIRQFQAPGAGKCGTFIKNTPQQPTSNFDGPSFHVGKLQFVAENHKNIWFLGGARRLVSTIIFIKKQ